MSDSAQQATEHDARRAADRLLLDAARHGGPWIGVLILMALVIAAAELALPAVLGRAVDAVIGNGPTGTWLLIAGLVVAVLAVGAALDDLAVGATTARSTAWLRYQLLDHVLALGPRAARRFSSGDVISRLVGNAADAGRVTPAFVWAMVQMVPGVGAIVALAVIDPWLALTFVVGLPVLVLLARGLVRTASAVSRRYLDVQGTIATRLLDALAGARTIAAAGTADRELGRVLAPLPELRRHGMGTWHVQAQIAMHNILLVSLLEVAVLIVAGIELARERITPGELLAASQYTLLGTRIGGWLTAIPQLARCRAAAARAGEMLRLPPLPYGTASLPAGAGRIEFRRVTVGSDDAVLKKVDLVVPAGALVAVVGRSGSGKSLLAALAGRLLDPDEGEVLLDGVPLRSLERSELRQAIGYGFERPVLLGKTIRDAISFGEREPPLPEIVAAARAARADEFIRHLPDGYRTRLADAPMSGGEVQRVGLARAFAHAGRVIILDDVAASLDTVTEHHISEVLSGALADRTRLVVAHRASTAARADLVVWLDSGVRAVAPHRELWRGAAYRALFEQAEHVPAAANAIARDGGAA